MKDEKDGNEFEERVKTAYKNGIVEGLKRCSWSEDGIRYVGMSKKTLESAIKEIEEEHKQLKLYGNNKELYNLDKWHGNEF